MSDSPQLNSPCVCVCAPRPTRPREEGHESNQSTAAAAAAAAAPTAGPAGQSPDTLMHHLMLALATAQLSIGSVEAVNLATGEVVVSVDAVQRQSSDRQPSPANQPAASRSFLPGPPASYAGAVRRPNREAVRESLLLAVEAAIQARTTSRPPLHLSCADPPTAGGSLATALPGRVNPSNGGGRAGAGGGMGHTQHGAGHSAATATAPHQPVPSQPVLPSLGPQSPGFGLPPSTRAARGSRHTPQGFSAQPQPQPFHLNSREFPDLSEASMTHPGAGPSAAARRGPWYFTVFHCMINATVHAQAVSVVLMCLLMGLTVENP